MINSYRKLVKRILKRGIETDSTFELLNMNLNVPMMEDLAIRKLAAQTAQDEAEWILSGSSNSAEAGRAAAFWKDFPSDLGDIYGSRIAKQFHKPAKNSRRNYFETGYYGALIPCVNSLQLFEREGEIFGRVC